MTKPKLPHLLLKTGRKPLAPEQKKRWTLLEIRERCLVTITDCWEWRCTRGASEHERCHKLIEHGGRSLSVRRVAYLLMFGRLPDDGRQVVPAKCTNPRCVNPAHCRAVTVKEKVAVALRRGTFVTPERTRNMRLAKQALCGKLPNGMEDARRIRALAGPAHQHAPRFGISVSLFNRIRRGDAWQEAQ